MSFIKITDFYLVTVIPTERKLCLVFSRSIITNLVIEKFKKKFSRKNHVATIQPIKKIRLAGASTQTFSHLSWVRCQTSQFLCSQNIFFFCWQIVESYVNVQFLLSTRIQFEYILCAHLLYAPLILTEISNEHDETRESHFILDFFFEI